jgi:multisubunit Na+/H+ antiporter MnhE subunit
VLEYAFIRNESHGVKIVEGISYANMVLKKVVAANVAVVKYANIIKEDDVVYNATEQLYVSI